jgi:hypothetical protein
VASPIKVVDLVRLVEAHLTGLDVDDDRRSVTLKLKTVTGERLEVSFRDTIQLLVSDFRESNIIDRLNVWDASSDPFAYRALLAELVCGTADPEDPRWTAVLDTKTRAIRSGEYILAEIEAVYGAQLLVLAKEVVVSADPVESALSS